MAKKKTVTSQNQKIVRISIIIPTYGRPQELKKCLVSIQNSAGLNKKFKAEIVLIDDTPNQKIIKLHNEYKKTLNLILIHSQKHLGISEKKNIGIVKFASCG